MIKKKPLTQVNWGKIMGNMPEATFETKGLMSKQDKMLLPINIAANDLLILKIHTHSRLWSRCSSIFWGSLSGVPIALCVASYLTNSEFIIKAEWFTPKNSHIKLYKKENDVYIYVNNNKETTDNLMGISSTKIEITSNGVAPDESYVFVE